MIQYSEQDIKRNLPVSAVRRGYRYWLDNYVIDVACKVEYDALYLLGHVQGSYQNAYHTQVKVIQAANGRINISAECTCPVGTDCKHGAAILYAYLRRPDLVPIENPENHLPEEQESGLDEEKNNDVEELLNQYLDEENVKELVTGEKPLNVWQSRLDNIIRNQTTPKKKSSNQHVVYILDVQKVQTVHYLRVNVFNSRLSNNNEYTKPKRIRNNDAAYVLPIDRKIIKLLSLNDSDFVNAMLPIDDADFFIRDQGAVEVLELLLNTGRCFWKQLSTQTQITQGESLPATLSWKIQPEGTQKLHFKVKNISHSKILPLAPLWYIDTKTYQCAPLELDIPNHLATLLLDTPAINPYQIDKFTTLLNKIPLIPQPKHLSVNSIIDERPIPHLCLHNEYFKRESYYPTIPEELHLSLLTLSFSYQDKIVEHHVAGDFIEYFDKRQQAFVRIKRRPVLESKALKELQSYGFRETIQNGHFQLYKNGHKFTHEFAVQDFLKKDQFEIEQKIIDFQLNVIPQLRDKGWQVEMSEDYLYQIIDPELIDEWYGEIDDTTGIDWFSLELGIHLNGEKIQLLPLLVDFLKHIHSRDELHKIKTLPDDTLLTLRVDEKRLLPVPVSRIRDIINILIELADQEPLDDEGRLRLNRLKAAQLAELEAAMSASRLRWFGGDRLLALGRKLQHFQGIESVIIPENFNADLRPYQQEGVNWLQFLREYELGGILADDMGLGKTVMTLAHLSIEKQAGRLQKPCLVVAPTSLMVNWKHESKRFAPHLNILILQGTERKKYFGQIQQSDIILTTYPLLPRDKKELLQHEYHSLILDEAQHIKNPKSQATQIVQQIRAHSRLCLTGTPMENHLGELWSLFHFLMPGFLGDLLSFKHLFRTPIEKEGDGARQQVLSRRVKPFMLRRTKHEVIQELPEKTEIIQSVELSGTQLDLYEVIRVTMHDKVRKEIESKGIARSQIVILDALLKLRQVCCDPRLVPMDAAAKVKKSAKLELLMEMLPEMVEEGRRILLFSQFTSMLALIEDELKSKQLSYSKLTGRTQNRELAINKFQDGDVPIFLISLKAGGTGLNLTTADTVIHYDPWWNPAVENQATDRAHRMGQDKNVFVYKFLTENTVETKIQELQQRKRALSEALFVGGNEKNSAKLSHEDLEALFEPLN
ncbi:DEAD/DEAH box helicase [Candidatus Albibeggiatoa sp. nov. NOAA]|uniref:DEAD/DEAH box helicase n=1 Tax=Candidatus Albibeggiatoa sp. nov. NOAA TaxID=3162724 RepID=UPI0032F84723|nr:DEAD/DEAH box helicase [Thiotrichaceae bacterium]